MANSATIQSEINNLRSQIAQFQAIFSSPTSLLSQKQQAQIDITRIETQIASLQSQLIVAQAQEQVNSAVVPPPPKTAGQTVNDDASNNPSKPPPLEADPATGRVRPVTTSTSPSNADVPATADTGDVDRNTNAPTKTFSQTQSTSGEPEQGSTPVLNPTTIQYPGTTVGDGLKRGPVTGSNPNTAVDVTAPNAIGVGANEDSGKSSPQQTATETNNAYNSAQQVQPQPNILDQFGSYTYSISVYLTTPEQYKTLVQSKVKTVVGYNLLFQSAGAAVSGANGGDPGAGRNPYFGDDFYIDSLSLTTKFPGKATTAAHSASEFKMTVIEPAGITFLDRLYKAVQDFVPKNGAGAINYTAVQYLLVIRWYGWDLNGELLKNPGGGPVLSDPNAVVEKFIPFTIRKVNWGVSNKLVTYELDCAPISLTMGTSTRRGTIPYDVELTDGTVKGLLAGDTVTQTTFESNTSPATAPAAPEKANSAPSSKTVIRQGLMGAMNDFQQKLVNDGVYTVADEYEVVFVNGAEVIANASVIKPQNIVKNLSSTPMAPPTTKAPSGADPKKTSVDNTVRNYSITAGQQIVQVLDLIIRNSTYITDQARIVEQEETEILEDAAGNMYTVVKNTPPVSKILWFNISVNAVPIQYDKKRNDYAYKITYVINPYVVQNFDSKYFPIPKFNGLHKSYKYWWTGENTSVLDYQVTFNALYNQTVSGSEPGNSATDRIREQRSSSMRDIAKYTYQARSTESSQGAKGAGNEVSANAAEYLYSPNDLSLVKLKIVGDPAWIAQGSMSDGVSTKNFNYTGFNADGSINFDSQEVLFEIAWQRPQDYDLGSGLADPYANIDGAREPIQSNIYHAQKCISEFKQGRFEQTIEGTLYSWPIPSGQNTPATKPVSVSVNSSGTSDRAAGTEATAPADITAAGTGTTPAPGGADAVNLQSTAPAAGSTTLSENLQPQQNASPDSNGVNVGVNLPAPGILGVNSVTTDPPQLINSSA